MGSATQKLASFSSTLGRSMNASNLSLPQGAGPTSILVVMGTAGCGKTSVAEELQKLLQCHYLEGDSLHPKANIAKMASGHPLTDDDRWPWLQIIFDRLLTEAKSDGRPVILTCSALRRAYRDFLRKIPADTGRVTFVYLKGERDLLLERITHRKGHFMASAMLDSQLETLEEPDPSLEEVIVADITPKPAVIAQNILDQACKQHIVLASR